MHGDRHEEERHRGRGDERQRPATCGIRRPKSAAATSAATVAANDDPGQPARRAVHEPVGRAEVARVDELQRDPGRERDRQHAKAQKAREHERPADERRTAAARSR